MVNEKDKDLQKSLKEIERLNKVLQALGGNKSKICEKYGLNNSTLRSWLANKRTINTFTLKALLGVNPDYIKNGSLPMFVQNIGVSNAHPVVAEPREYYGGVEFIMMDANASKKGGLTDFNGSFIVNKDVKRSYKASYKQVRVSGESMEPSIPDGWIVTFDTGLMPDHKDVVVATSTDTLVVKRFKQINGKYYLTSDNPSYEDILIDENVTIHGVVIEFFKP